MKVGFLQDREESYRTGEVTRKMHDLVHDLARQILKDELIFGMASTNQIKMCRYLSLTSWPRGVDRKLFDKVRALFVSGRNLEMKHCDNLCMLPECLGELQPLQSLDIINLPAMSVLPEPMQRLTSLRSLFIFVCDALRQLPEQLGELCSLADLVIVDVPALTHLPESMRRLTSLRYLNLASCVASTQLPESLGELSALLRVGIQSCSGLTSLPRFIGRLTGPEELTINKCPELVRRCREGLGEDWHLISHVPELRLLD
ncbi:hypothetical protein SEVIR_3G388701v4 [Setaria viridis]